MKNQTFRLTATQVQALDAARAFMGHTKQEALTRALESYLRKVEEIKAAQEATEQSQKDTVQDSL